MICNMEISRLTNVFYKATESNLKAHRMSNGNRFPKDFKDKLLPKIQFYSIIALRRFEIGIEMPFVMTLEVR